jgi:hypothetical protein
MTRMHYTAFLQNHAKDLWVCDFLQVTDLFFRPLTGDVPSEHYREGCANHGFPLKASQIIYCWDSTIYIKHRICFASAHQGFDSSFCSSGYFMLLSFSEFQS